MNKQPFKIALQNLRKSFNHNHVLRGIDLEIKEGESVVIIGGSGTGKSVLIKCIIGLLTADEGSTIKIEGIDLNKASSTEEKRLRGKISMLFQGSALFDSIPVW